MFILEEKIKDRRFTDLIRKALKAGHFNYFGLRSGVSNVTHNSLRSLLYPVLIDIFFVRLDNYVSSLADQFTKVSSNEVKLSYVREGDQLILGVKGSYSDCVNNLNLLVDFFKQNLLLKVSKEAFEIINLSNKKEASSIIFSGVRIYIPDLKLFSFNRKIIFSAPINSLMSKLTKAGFLKNKKPVPKLT